MFKSHSPTPHHTATLRETYGDPREAGWLQQLLLLKVFLLTRGFFVFGYLLGFFFPITYSFSPTPTQQYLVAA